MATFPGGAVSSISRSRNDEWLQLLIAVTSSLKSTLYSRVMVPVAPAPGPVVASGITQIICPDVPKAALSWGTGRLFAAKAAVDLAAMTPNPYCC